MAPTISTIARYGTHQEFSVDFFGDDLIVTETETPSVIRRWIRDVVFFHRRSRSSHPLVVGVGVQWTPSGYHSDYSSPDRYYNDSPRAKYDPPADTLQLCVGKRCIIIKLSHCNRVPDVLRSFLTNPNTTFVGVWNSQDAKKLALSRHQLEIGELLDIREYVRDSDGMSLKNRSFEKIVENCMGPMGYQGVSVDQEISTSDWSVDYLSLDQILQASIDAYVCFKIGVWDRLWEV